MCSGYSEGQSYQKARGQVADAAFVVREAPEIHPFCDQLCWHCDGRQDEHQLPLSGAKSAIREWLTRISLLSQAEFQQAEHQEVHLYEVQSVLDCEA